MKHNLILELEAYLHEQDFGRNWDGAYQDVIPAIRDYFATHGFETHFLSEWESPSRDPELVAQKERTIVRVPWAKDTNGRSLVVLQSIQIQEQS